MSFYLLNKPGGYLSLAKGLIAKHALKLPTETEVATVEAFAKRIMFTRYRDDYETRLFDEALRQAGWEVGADKLHKRHKEIIESREIKIPPKHKTVPLKPRIEKAINHCNALLRYSAKPPSRPTSISNRQRKLRDALSDPKLAILLAVSQQPINVSAVLQAIEDQKLRTCDLDNLLSSLKENLIGEHTGRPKDEYAFVLSSAKRVWVQAGLQPKYSYNAGKLKGHYVDFVKDVIKTCGLPPLSDEALNSRLKESAKKHEL